MAGELFKRLAGGLDIVHIPYKGIGQGVTDLISGVIPMFSANATAQILDLARAGKVRILSVNSAERIKAAPDIPTSTEAGLPGMVAQTTFAIFAPAGTPAGDRRPARRRDAEGDGGRGFPEAAFESRFRAGAGHRRRKGHRGVQG